MFCSLANNFLLFVCVLGESTSTTNSPWGQTNGTDFQNDSMTNIQEVEMDEQNVPPMSEYLSNAKELLNTYQINNLIAQVSNCDNETMEASYVGEDYIPRNEKLDCSQTPPNLVGPMVIKTDRRGVRPAPKRVMGGEWKPEHCLANHNVAIIIPYRGRGDHLSILLSNLHPFLQRQQLHYKIYVVEQFGNSTFNKARLMNIGFTEALKDNVKWECFIFHDVDLIPEDDRNMYSCPKQPRHLSVAVDLFNYTLPYTLLVGGVFAIRTEHFFQVNGYSNIYWGWGGEDDDMGYRVVILLEDQPDLLTMLHETHPRIVGMKNLTRSHFWWPKIDEDIQHLVAGCETCCQTANNPLAVPLQLAVAKTVH